MTRGVYAASLVEARKNLSKITSNRPSELIGFDKRG